MGLFQFSMSEVCIGFVMAGLSCTISAKLVVLVGGGFALCNCVGMGMEVVFVGATHGFGKFATVKWTWAEKQGVAT